MASLLLGVGVLSYDQIKKQKAKRTARKEYNSARFSELEAENARRIATLQETTCFCQTSDWRGGNCKRHGYVPPAGEPGGPSLAHGHAPPPQYEERQREEPTTRKNGSGTPQRPYGEIGYQYRRGEEDGAMAHVPFSNGVRRGEQNAGLPSREGDVARINGERRKRMKAGGFANWTLRRKEGRGEADVR